MADIIVTTDASAGTDARTGCWGPYWISTTVGMIIFIEGTNNIEYARTTDGGATWSITQIMSANNRNMACWLRHSRCSTHRWPRG